MVVRQGLKLVLVGLVAGMAASYAVARAVGSFLYQTESHDDVVTFAAVPAVLVVIALAACVLPAWRAARVDPAPILRTQGSRGAARGFRLRRYALNGCRLSWALPRPLCGANSSRHLEAWPESSPAQQAIPTVILTTSESEHDIARASAEPVTANGDTEDPL